METYAYNRAYLDGAMTALATLLDYAVNYRNEHIDFFFQKFIRMGFAMQFERGNPDVVAGRSGVELYMMFSPFVWRSEYLSHVRLADALFHVSE